MAPSKKSKQAASAKPEGLERTDNNMNLSSWPQVVAINQKNYYTDYLKRDDQILAYRLQKEEDRARAAKKARAKDRANAPEVADADADADADGDTAMTGYAGDSQQADGGGVKQGVDEVEANADTEAEAEPEGEEGGRKTIVIHFGSQNLRIGFASDALPKTMPMVVAHQAKESESEENGGEPRPKRRKMNVHGDGNGSPDSPSQLFSDEFGTKFTEMSTALKSHMRLNKRRALPNSAEMVINYNRRTSPETIPEHNDPLRVEYTNIPTRSRNGGPPEHVVGEAALKIPDDSTPRYKLFWPFRHGWCNEKDYNSRMMLFHDITLIVEHAIKVQLNLPRKKDWAQYSCVVIVPDLYDRAYVTEILDVLIREFNFARVCFIQESLAGSFGAGFTTACVVDIGAQKTSVCCVDEGMCIENSRINMKMGGEDVTELFIKMMLFDHFPYADINLKRRYDWLLAEELKKNICTLNEANVSVQLFDFHLRVSGKDTRKYTFKAYDEVLLAPAGLFDPNDIFDNSDKLSGRGKILGHSRDLYDAQPNDPISMAQLEVLSAVAPPSTPPQSPKLAAQNSTANNESQSTPIKSPHGLQPLNNRHRDLGATPRSSNAASPAPDGASTPQSITQPVKGSGSGTPGTGTAAASGPTTTTTGATTAAITAVARLNPLATRDDVLPIGALDNAIYTSITNSVAAARPDGRKITDFLGGILVLGGGSLVPGFLSYLEERMQANRPEYANAVMVGAPPRELDPQVVVWKGGSVFGKLEGNDSWVTRMEYDRLGSRILTYKCMWPW